jgi:RNA polymerase sigma-70 factor, ECF subfamily
MSEQTTIIQCISGNVSEFAKLYEAYVQPVYRFIYYKTHHRETAEDITSATFMKALEKIQTFNPNKASFKTWLYQIARNNVIDHYRSHKESMDIDDVWDLNTGENLETDTDTKMKLDSVREYLKKLKPEQREIVVLRVWDGRSFQEIAEITGKTEASCKMMFKRTVDKLRGDMAVLALLIYFINN